MADPNNIEAKRQAMTGQWRTPPLPAFGQGGMPPHPMGGNMQQQPQQQQLQGHPVHPGHPGNTTASMPPPQPVASVPIPSNNVLQEAIPLPESTDDYAKALQEAYRRGAEAAARLQQQQQMSASCPNLQQFQGQGAQAPPNDPTVASSLQQQQQQQVVPNPLQRAPVQPQPPQPMQMQHTHHAPQPVAAAVPQQQPMQVHHVAPPPQPQQIPQQQHQQQQQAPSQQSAASRSLSLPDMQSYAARAQAEEEKRKKRLARNRASARLRRLRKKNLVDSYEGEVGVLEASLQKLKAHTWGTSHDALLEALSMERGQQELSNEERVQLIHDILTQQRKQVEFLRESQREQQVLLAVVENPQDELSQEVQAVLNLTDQQKEDIRKSCHGIEQEVEAMETFIQCLEAMQDKSWLWNDGVAQIANQFTSVLHANQLAKFLLWTDANAEALDTLEYCHAPPSKAPPAGAPVFQFGMDDHHASHSGAGASGGAQSVGGGGDLGE